MGSFHSLFGAATSMLPLTLQSFNLPKNAPLPQSDNTQSDKQ